VKAIFCCGKQKGTDDGIINSGAHQLMYQIKKNNENYNHYSKETKQNKNE
jgi:hypothetical protein